jgi:hypothetical protein
MSCCYFFLESKSNSYLWRASRKLLRPRQHKLAERKNSRRMHIPFTVYGHMMYGSDVSAVYHRWCVGNVLLLFNYTPGRSVAAWKKRHRAFVTDILLLRVHVIRMQFIAATRNRVRTRV